MRLRCPNGHSLKVPVAMAGQRGRCPCAGCGAIVTVPALFPGRPGTTEATRLSSLPEPFPENAPAGLQPLPAATGRPEPAGNYRRVLFVLAAGVALGLVIGSAFLAPRAGRLVLDALDPGGTPMRLYLNSVGGNAGPFFVSPRQELSTARQPDSPPERLYVLVKRRFENFVQWSGPCPADVRVRKVEVSLRLAIQDSPGPLKIRLSVDGVPVIVHEAIPPAELVRPKSRRAQGPVDWVVSWATDRVAIKKDQRITVDFAAQQDDRYSVTGYGLSYIELRPN
jgi:hypothetical protein